MYLLHSPEPTFVARLATQLTVHCYNVPVRSRVVSITAVMPSDDSSHVSPNKLHPDLVSAVYDERWADVGMLLERGVSDTSHRWAVKRAGERLEGGALANYILPYSRDDQLDVLLTEVVNRGRWWVVGQLLKRGVGDDAQRAWAVEEAGKRALSYELAASIVPYCTGEQLESLLVDCVKTTHWETVGRILERGVGDARCKWAVGQTAKCAEYDTFVSDILRHTKDDQLEPVLTEAVRRGLWRGACELLQRDVSDTSRKFAVQKATENATDSVLSLILPHCADDQKEFAVTLSVERGLWLCVSRLLDRGVDTALHTWAVTECSKRGTACDINDHMLKHCTDAQVVLMLKTAMKRELWDVVGEILTIHPETKAEDGRHVFVTAGQRATEHFIIHTMVPCCSAGDVDQLLPIVVKRRLWAAIVALLKHGLSDSQRMWVAEEAIGRAELTALSDILPLCAAGQFESVFMIVVKKYRWVSLPVLLKCEITDTQRAWAVKEACTCMRHEFLMEFYVVDHCQASSVNFVLETAVKRGFWRVAAMLLPKTTDDELCGWAVCEACKSAKQYELSDRILRPCPASHLQSAVAALMRRRFWPEIRKVLPCNMDEKLRKKILEQISKHAPEEELVPIISSHYPTTGIESVVKAAAKRGLWRILKETLQRGHCSEGLRDWVVESASRAVRNGYVLSCIVPYCTDNTVETVLRTVVKRAHWSAAVNVLGRVQHNDVLRGWALRKASKSVRDTVMSDIVHHCPKGEFDSVLLTVARRDLWRSVTAMLETDFCSDALRVTVVKQAVKRHLKLSESNEWTLSAVFGCGVESLDIVMSELVKRQDWCVVRQILKMSEVRDDWHGKEDGNLCTDAHLGDGTTFTHIVCFSGLMRTLPLTVQCGADPLAMSEQWGPLLNAAVLCRERPERMVVECFKLGVSTHQRRLTAKLGHGRYFLYSLMKALNNMLPKTAEGRRSQLVQTASPLECAFARRNCALIRLLYESGASHSGEIDVLCQRALLDYRFVDVQEEQIGEAILCLQRLATTPRSLKSSCRLVISHHLGVGGNREDKVKQLPLPDSLQGYVDFLDLVADVDSVETHKRHRDFEASFLPAYDLFGKPG